MKSSEIQKDLQSIPFKDPVPSNPKSREMKARLLLLKRKEFAYENEIRIIVVKKDKTKEEGIEVEFDSINLKNLINSIMIDPTVGCHTTKALKFLLKKRYGFSDYISETGKHVSRVKKSQLYSKSSKDVIIKF